MTKLVAASLLLMVLALPCAGQGSGYVINGRVINERGAPVRGVRVCAIIENFTPGTFFPCGVSDAQGEFTLAARGPGKYTLTYDDANGRRSSVIPFFRNPSSRAPEVSVDEAGTSRPVTIKLPSKSGLHGLLVGRGVDASTGQPLDKLEFVLCHADAPDVCWRGYSRSAEGEFRISAAYVPFNVRVRADGYEDWLGPEGGESAEPVSVAPGTKLELSVRLKRSAASEGKALTEADKRPGVNLPAPAQTAPADGTFFNHFPRLTTLEWSPIEGAVSYSVEIDFCTNRRRAEGECDQPLPIPLGTEPWPPGSGIVGTSYTFKFLGAQPGRWRVWAVDAEGREGFKSPWWKFFYGR